MGATLLKLAISVLCNVIALIVWLVGYLMFGSAGATLLPAVVLGVIGMFICPPANEVDTVLDAIRHDVNQLQN